MIDHFVDLGASRWLVGVLIKMKYVSLFTHSKNLSINLTEEGRFHIN